MAGPDGARPRAALPTSACGALLRHVLPSWACGADRAGDLVPSAELFPEEEAQCAQAGPRRRAEFTAGRWCAHRALAALGAGRVAVPRSARGMPVWPDGVVGSITHCEGYRAAAVCRSQDARALGIDAEPAAPLSERVRAGLFGTRSRNVSGDMSGTRSRDVSADESGAEEDAFATDLARRLPGLPVDRLLFSAKEAAYKAWSSYADRPPPLRAVRVVSAPADRAAVAHALPALPALSGSFTVRVPRGFALRHGDHLYGSWHADAGLLISSALIVHGAAERLQGGSAWVSST
ncbi:4'-phosphopantetheinyl transferase [Streptomyces sp. NPDC050564]|uniref:4'-phosphopantetheinyl transferase n=1 Tax=Streptomyces sp. NPDC050564 TaxID=3365631 RepID=UPI00378C56DA